MLCCISSIMGKINEERFSNVVCYFHMTKRDNICTPSCGTQCQCGSQKFQNTVRYLSEICQKTVSYKNVSEFCQKTVRCKYLSELYQTRFGNASEMCLII